jgi:hypothetical protein
MRYFVIPENFFKSIAERGKLYSRIWFYWLSDFSDEFFEIDFIEKQESKFPNVSELREVYEFGIQLLSDFKIIEEKKKKASKPLSKLQKAYAKEIINYLNEKAGTSYSLQSNQELIVARLKDGFMVEDFKIVIDKKVKDWKGTDWSKYLRPLTLFSKSKFENYLNSQDEPAIASDFNKFTESIIKAAEQLGQLRK